MSGFGVLYNNGVIYSVSGGFQFPDNTVQTTAATSSAVKAFLNFNGSGTPAIRSSLNVSSITDHGIGDYTINFITALADANYAVIGTVTLHDGSSQIMTLTNAKMTAGNTYQNKSTTGCRITSQATDYTDISIAFLR